MKNRSCVIIFVLGLIVLSACNSKQNVKLCDYKNIEIPQEVRTITEEDVNFAIQMRMLGKRLIIPDSDEMEEGYDFVELTDEIAVLYFGYSSALDMKEQIEDEICEHRCFEYLYQYILSHSYIRNTYEREDYLKRIGKKIPDSDIDEAKAFYDEYCIVKALLEAENSTLSDEELEKSLDLLAEELGMQVSELLEETEMENLIYTVYYSTIYDILLKYC